jgi:hypothetical protein
MLDPDPNPVPEPAPECTPVPVPLRLKVAVPAVPVPVPKHWLSSNAHLLFYILVTHMGVSSFDRCHGEESK